MADQAEKLRELVKASSRAPSRASEATFSRLERALEPDDRRARVIAVTSGKGGVGKTNLTTALAVTLASRGQRVLVFDADLSLANVDVLLGLRPKYNLSHVISGQKRVSEVVIEGPRGIRIVPASSGIQELSELHPDEQDLLVRELSRLTSEADTIFIDTAAGLSDNVLGFVTSADEVIVVTTPEPTAYTDAYAMLKVLAERSPGIDAGLLVNMALSRREAETALSGVTMICRQFLSLNVRNLGWIPRDPEVSRSIRKQQPFVEFAPNAPASRAVREVAGRLMCRAPRPTQEGFWRRIQTFFARREETARETTPVR